jgi:hypothetical protein
LGTSPKGRGKAACGGKQSAKLKFEILSWGYFVFFHFFRGKLFPTAKKAAKELIL